VLFVGDDWAEDHHDVEIVDSDGKRLGRARLPEGMAGMTRLHEMIGEYLDEDAVDPQTGMLAPGRVVVGIETDRGPWVSALIGSGYQVYAINPMSVARYRERHSTSGAKSDPGDAHVLAEIVRIDRAHHRPVAGDSGEVEGLKLIARTHQSLIWDRTRHLQRLRQVLREYYPGLLDALAAAKLELGDPDAWELIERAPDPDQAARLSRSKITAILTRNRRRNAEARAEQIQAVLRAPALRQPAAVQTAYATIAVTQLQLLIALAGQIPALEEVLARDFGRHPDAEIYTSLPGLGVVLGARVLSEFGDDPHRYRDAKARKNYAGTSPITRASGRKTVVLARYARNRRLGDAIHQWAFCALTSSPGARTYAPAGSATTPRCASSGTDWSGILHGCLKTRAPYSESTAWTHHHSATAA
jgi:Transposase/Transposase IS116/IS110/IS902 family